MSSLVSKFRKYLSVETAGGASWSPDNASIAFAYDAPGVYQVFRARLETSKALWPERLTFFEDRCTDPRWLSDGSILFTMDRGGDENFQQGIIGAEDEIDWITHDDDAKHRPTYSSDDYLYYIANIDDKSRFDIYRRKIPLKVYEPEKIREAIQGIEILQCTDEEDRQAIFSQYRGNNEQDLFLLSTDSRDTVNLTKNLSKRKTRWEAIRFLDKEHLLVITDHESDYQRFAVLGLDRSVKKYEGYESGVQWEIEASTWHRQNEYTYFSENKEGYSSLYRAIFNPDGIDKLETINLPIDGVLVSGDSRSFANSMKLSPNGRYLAVSLSSSTNPTNIWIIETETKRAWMATRTSTHGLKKDDFAPVELHRFKSFDGLSVPYFKYLPKAEKPAKGYPTIFIIHGGPESQIRPSFSPIIQFYLSAGYAVTTPNIRGSTGYGRTYMDLDNIEKRLDSIADIKSLAEHLSSEDESIDSSRLVVYGGSYGGFAVLSSITEYPDTWRAAVDIVGISDFVTFLKNTADWRRSLREAEYGSLEDDRDTLEAVSPIHKVDQIQCPLFIIQGDNDERVPLSESMQIYESVKARGINVRLLRFADEGHGLAKLENRLKAYSEILEWLGEIV
jgi:dipeptidyl aminopeptidase/acylaminoacyl peptidase